MKVRNKGFTLIELMIGIVAVCILGSIIVGGFAAAFNLNSSKAETDAVQFAQKMYRVKDAAASCTNADTDGDGYVSCTVTGDDGHGRLVEKYLECAKVFTFNSGCKTTRMVFQNTQPVYN